MSSLSPHWLRRRILRRVFFLVVLLLLPGGVLALFPTPEEELTYTLSEGCRARIDQQMRFERALYRHVQYGSGALVPSGRDVPGVLQHRSAQTIDLLPYLVLNIHALDCRLRSFCDAVDTSLGYLPQGTGTVLPHRPLGCSRVFTARGRWWSPTRRDLAFSPASIPECTLPEDAPSQLIVPAALTELSAECRSRVRDLLVEERALLPLLVAQHGVSRNTRDVPGLLQEVLWQLRFVFLEQLREVVDLFGSILHPIPCVLTQCD